MEEKFEKHREFLADRIDPDFGLLDKLLANRTLTREGLHKIKLKDNTTEDKNRILLDFILKKKKANELASALKDIGQDHLVNYLNADGEFRFSFGDDWPLGESEINRLAINRESLVDLLDTSDLCIRLFSEKVINNRQKQLILSKPTDSEKNEALLDTLTKFSLRQYRQTIACLHDSNQSHIADLLSKGGVVVRVHANLEGAVGNVDEMEDEIISQLTTVLENRPPDEAIRLLELTQQRIIATRKGHSIILYIHCLTHDELLQLIDLLQTDELKYAIERGFAELLLIRDVLRVSLTWSLDEFTEAVTYFESYEKQSTEKIPDLRYLVTSMFTGGVKERKLHGSGIKGWSHRTRKGKILEEIKTSEPDLDSSEDENEGKRGKSHDIQARYEDYFYMKRKLEQTQKENDKLTKLLEHRTQTEYYTSAPIICKRIGRRAETTRKCSSLETLLALLFSLSCFLIIFYYFS